MGPATSAGAAMRPRGMSASIRRRASSSSAGAAISVSIHPGATQFTVMPRGASSPEKPFTREMSAPFVAA